MTLSGYKEGPGLMLNRDCTGATPSTIGCGGGGCHSSSAAATTTVSVALYNSTGTTLITTGYTGGTSYLIQITGTQTSSSATLPRFGFQVSAVSTASTSTNEGTLSAITGTHLGTYGGISIVEHSSQLAATSGTGGSGTTYVVKIPWTAPVAGSGSVTIFGVLNAVNYNGGADAGDLWNNGSLVLPEVVSGVLPITGTTTVCAGATTPLADATSGGTWSSSRTTIATVSGTGVVTGVAAGTSIISYNVSSVGVATAVVEVSPLPTAPAVITGSKIICVDKTTPLGDVTAGGVWSSKQTTLATVSGTGVVTGVAVGLDTIVYTVTNTCGSATSTHTMSVRAAGSCYFLVDRI